MGTVFGRIDNNIESLTHNEMIIAKYIKENPNQVVSDSIKETARRCGVSVASVSRLAIALGYGDWKELRHNLVRDSSISNSPVFSVISKVDDEQTIARKVFEGVICSLQDTLDCIKRDNLCRFTHALHTCSRVIFFGTGGSGYIARDEAIRFSHLKMGSEAYTQEYQMIIQAIRMRKSEIAVGISNSGRSRSTVNALGEARKRQVLTVGIANFWNTPLEQVSDLFFCTSYPKWGGITASLTARIAIMCIMDVLYILAAHNGLVSDNVSHIDMVVEKYLRIPAKHLDRTT